jgi:oxygen-dependent protoporphyrinogen oxidase
MQSVHDGDWLIEPGPNSALETTPLFQQLFDELGISDQVRYANQAADKRYILRDGGLHALPMSVGSFITSSLWTARGKFRLLKEPFVGRAAQEESVAGFVERRLGREFLDYAINPFVAGVYAGSPEQLSVQSAFPKLYALEQKYGGLVKGMVKGRRERKQRAEKAKDRARMFSFSKGMGIFPEAIAWQLGKAVRYECRAQRVDVRPSTNGEGRYTVAYTSNGILHSASGDVVVLSTPAYAASEVVKAIAPDLSDTLRQVFYPPVVEAFLGYTDEQIGIPLDGFGFLAPAVEKRNILGTIWSSVLFEGRAPAHHVALTTFVGGTRQPDLAHHDDAEILSVVKSELADIMKISGSPVYSRISRWEKAIPQYNLGYHKTIETIEKCERENPGLFFCSNYRGGIAVGDCVMNAEKTAAEVLKFLERKQTLQQSVTQRDEQ